MQINLKPLFLGAAGVALYASTSLSQTITPDNANFTINDPAFKGEPITISAYEAPKESLSDTDTILGLSGAKIEQDITGDFRQELGKQLFGKPFTRAAEMDLKGAMNAATQMPRISVTPYKRTFLEKMADNAAKGVKNIKDGKDYGPVMNTGAKIVNWALN